ncbi:MAG: hypothetical protein L7H04_01195 [Vulcanisaeta sp.]|nr:hypothetical protein [Vulcanisaeta sp.]
MISNSPTCQWWGLSNLPMSFASSAKAVKPNRKASKQSLGLLITSLTNSRDFSANSSILPSR